MFRKFMYLGLMLMVGTISIEMGMSGAPELRQSGQERLPLVLTATNPTAEFRTGMPVNGIIELVAGNYFVHDNLCLKTPEHQQIAVQAEVLENWPDGSARLVQVDFWDDFGPAQVRVYTLNRDRQKLLRSGDEWVTPLEQGVRVNTGRIEFRVTSENVLENIHFDANLNGSYESSEMVVAHGDLFLRQNGLDFQTSFSRGQVEVLEKGALKCRLAVSGWLANVKNDSVAKYRLEIEAFRNQPYIFISPWIEMSPVPDEAARVMKVHLSLFSPDRLEKCHFGETRELQNIVIQDWVRLIQERPDFYKVTNQDGTFADGETGPGWVDILNGNKNFTIYQRNFGKQKGFLLRPDEIIVYLWPPHAGFASPEKLRQFGQADESAKSPHQILLYFHSDGTATRQIAQMIETCEGKIPRFQVSPVMSEM